MITHPAESKEPVQPVNANVTVARLAVNAPPVVVASAVGSPSAMAEIPAVIDRASFEFHLRELTREFQPVGHLEGMVVRDMARHVAAMEVWNEGGGALQRQRAQHLPDLVIPECDDNGEREDTCLAAAVSAPDVHLAEQHGQRRSRALYRSIRTLLDLQARRRCKEPIVPQNHFLTETACEDYLRNRFDNGCHQCPRCGCRRGHYISTRRSWECGKCNRQMGLRTGTVAADSPLPLVIWFAAIRWLLWNPSMGTTELGIKLGITRSATVRSMAQRIIGAMASENSTELLAGLDVYHARCPARAPDSGVSEDAHACPVCEGVQDPPGSEVNPVDMKS